MATSGSKSVAVTPWDTLKFSWSEKSQSIANNTTTISWTLQLIATGSGYISSSASKAWSVTVNGTKYSGTNTVGISNNSTKTLASGTTTISHASDGTKSFNYSFSQQFDINFDGWVGTVSGSGSGTLDTIPRKSGLSVGNGTLGVALTLTVDRKSSSFTHTITYTCGSASGTVATKSSSTSISWTPPLSLASQKTNGTSVSLTFTITTYSGSASIGSNTKAITCAIPASVKPSCTLTLEDTTGWDDTYGQPVQGLSKIKITVNPTLAYGSAIASYTISADGSKYSTATATTGVLKTTGDSPVTATVKDKRGRSGSASYTMKVLAYAPPNVSKLAVNRCDADGTENDQGEHIRVVFSAAVTALNNKNTAAYKLRFKKSTDSAYTEVAFADLANTYTVNNKAHIFAADSNRSYEVEIEARDRHGAAARSTSASTAFTLINWGADGTSMGIGKVAEKPNTLEVALAMEVSQPIALAEGGKQLLNLTSDFVLYSGRESNRPWCRKTAAGVVELHGVVSPANSNNLIATDTVIICTLPEGYRPAVGFYHVCQGSSLAHWLLSVAPDGTVGAQRYRTGETSQTPGTTAWLTFHVTFIADQ